jgi:hypothetical protein
MFTQKFDIFACEGDSIECEREGFTVIARIERDCDYHIDHDDGHNPNQSVTGCDDAQQAKLLEARQLWLENEWFYCGIVLDVYFNDIPVSENAASLWGIECNYPGADNSYLQTEANELLEEAIEDAKGQRARIIEALSA